MSALRCPIGLIEVTLEHLRRAGQLEKECVVFWLSARPVMPGATIIDAYLPEQHAAEDVFRIPPSGMTKLMQHLRTGKFGLAAQIHSHPGRAFHSKADDKWAVVRHEGALSLVVPHFARDTTAANFLDKTVAFALSASDKWLEVPQREFPNYLELV